MQDGRELQLAAVNPQHEEGGTSVARKKERSHGVRTILNASNLLVNIVHLMLDHIL